MSDTGAYQSTPRRRSVSESESDPMNSTINLQGNPKMYVPPERPKSNPNISGLIDESLYTGPGTRLQLQREGIEIWTDRILNLFHNLQSNINERESSIRNFPSSSVEIHQKFNLFTKDSANLSNQALLAAVSTAIHRDILNLGDILAIIKRLGLINLF